MTLLAAVFGLGEGHNKGQVVLVVAVVVDVEAVDGFGVERRLLGERVAVEDEHGFSRVVGGFKDVKISEVEPGVAFGGPESQAGEVVRHNGLLVG